MLLKDKDILADTVYAKDPKMRIRKENMRSAWGDVFDYYLRGITTRYLRFSGRATRLEFWGFILVSSLVFLLIYPLGLWADIPNLAYYYALATLLPTVAVFARRLHDLNKSALLYLGIWVACCLSALIIGYWSLILILAWTGFMFYILFKESDTREGLYGPALETDEKYDVDNMPILRKFRFLALSLLIINLGITACLFNDWRTQAEFMGTKDEIMTNIEKECKKAQLTDEQCEAAKAAMIQTLKEWSGETVMPEDITKAINNAINSVRAILGTGAPNVAVTPNQAGQK